MNNDRTIQGFICDFFDNRTISFDKTVIPNRKMMLLNIVILQCNIIFSYFTSPHFLFDWLTSDLKAQNL